MVASSKWFAMVDLSKLSAKRLDAEIDKRRIADGEGLTALIAGGYGETTGNQLDAMVKAGQASQMVIEARKASHAYHAALDEQDKRRRYHGSDKPIKAKPVW